MTHAAPGPSGRAPERSERAAGVFICVVGPSGVGKDTLIAATCERLSHDPRFAFPRRWITRPPGARERAEELGRQELARRRAAGGCALHWEAHGIAYAIPGNVDREIAAGRTVVCNVSRGVVADALVRFPRVATVVVAASRTTLAARLAARGREGAQDQQRRLSRRPRPLPPGMPTVTIDNTGALETATAAFIEALRGLAAGQVREREDTPERDVAR